jgi:predicted CoA-binding protein
MFVAILGASSNPERYAYIAAQRLLAANHRVAGVNPALPSVRGVSMHAAIPDLPSGVHTLTVYVGAPKSSELADAIVNYGFERVIFNPGAENPPLAARLKGAGTKVVEACTLVMLSTREF